MLHCVFQPGNKIRKLWFLCLFFTLRTETVENPSFLWWKTLKIGVVLAFGVKCIKNEDVLTGPMGGWPMKAPPPPINAGFMPPTTSPGLSSPPFRPTTPGFIPTTPGFRPPTTRSFYTVCECKTRYRWFSIVTTIFNVSSILASKH